jgi:hypothetical protein
VKLGNFTLKVAVFVSVSFLKVFAVGITGPQVPIPALLGFRISDSPVANKLSNAVGRQTVGFEPLHDDGDDEYEVVFAPLEATA